MLAMKLFIQERYLWIILGNFFVKSCENHTGEKVLKYDFNISLWKLLKKKIVEIFHKIEISKIF